MLLPAFLCPVVAKAVLSCGAMPVLVDVEVPGGAIDHGAVRAALTRRTRAVIIVHLFGVPVDFHSLKADLIQAGIAILEDCAPCLSGSIQGNPVGALGNFSVFSFNLAKPISLGGGGMLLCSDTTKVDAFHDWKQRTRGDRRLATDTEAKDLMAFLASQRSARREMAQRAVLQPNRRRRTKVSRVLHKFPWILVPYRRFQYHKAPVDESSTPAVGQVRAALGLRLLQQYSSISAQRNSHARYLLGHLATLGSAMTPSVGPGVEPDYSCLNLFVRDQPPWRLSRLRQRLRAAGHWSYRVCRVSLDLDPSLSRFVFFGLRRGSSLRNAQLMAAHSVSLSVDQNLTTADMDHMLAMIGSALEP